MSLAVTGVENGDAGSRVADIATKCATVRRTIVGTGA